MEQAVLLEVTKLGVPLRAWEDYSYVLGLNSDGLLGFASTIRMIDSTYADDFWTKPGYLGTEQSDLGDLFRSAKIDFSATIAQVNRNEHNEPTSFVLESVPSEQSKTKLDFTVYNVDGTMVGQLTGSLNASTKLFTLGSGNSSSVLNAIETGAKLQLDNRWYLNCLH